MQILILTMQIHANYILNIGAKIFQYFKIGRAVETANYIYTREINSRKKRDYQSLKF